MLNSKWRRNFTAWLCKFWTVGWSDLFIWQKTALNQRSGMILVVQIQIFGARTAKFSFSKISRGTNYQYLFVTIGIQLPFTLKNKHRKKFEIWVSKTTILDPQKSVFLVFEENPPNKNLSSCFGLDSALKTLDPNMSSWSVFLKTH